MPSPIRAERVIGEFQNVEDWHIVGNTDEPVFSSSWVNYNASGYSDAAFYKDPFGVVHLRGLVKDGTVGSANTIFILPEGYRPAAKLLFPRVSSSGGTLTLSRADIFADGRVVPWTGANTWFTLDGISFRAA